MSPCQSSPTMADIHNNTTTKRRFSSSGDDACRRLVTGADAHGNQELEEMSAVKKMRLQSNEATGVVNELFSTQPIHSRDPLGLNLTKSPSFLELIQKKLALAAKVKRTQVTENVPSYGVIPSNSTATEGMKPSHFQASLLRIGDWEWKSRQQGDLVAKFYFAKSKLAWEILHEGLKSKIEIKCSDICALRISCPKDLPSTLDIMVSVAPQFFRETNPLPYKSTRWIHTTDFTGGQARILSRHSLRCDPGIMDKHIESLLSVDHRLYALSQANNINPESPFLGTFCSVPEIPLSSSHRDSYGNDDNLFWTEQTGESFPVHPMPMEKPPVGLNHSGALQGVYSPSTDKTSRGTEQLKSDKFSWKKFFETTGVPQKSSVSYPNNLVNSESSYSRSNYLSPPEVIRSFPSDNKTNRQVESHSQSSHAEHDVLSPCSEKPAEQRAPLQKDMFNWKNLFQIPCQTQPSSVSSAGIMNNDSANGFNNQTNSQDLNGSQTLPQNPPSNDNISPDRMALEGISQNLLSDDEVVNSVEKETLLSTVNSFYSLIGQASAPLSQSSRSQASNTLAAPPPPDVEPTQVINSDTSESSGDDDSFLLWMQSPSLSWELSPEDMAFLSELLP